jgi:hypothetical protein
MLRVMLGDICPLLHKTLYRTCVGVSIDFCCGVRTVLNVDLRETEKLSNNTNILSLLIAFLQRTQNQPKLSSRICLSGLMLYLTDYLTFLDYYFKLNDSTAKSPLKIFTNNLEDGSKEKEI